MDSAITILKGWRRPKLLAKKENDGKERNFKKLKMTEEKGLRKRNRKRIKRDLLKRGKK